MGTGIYDDNVQMSPASTVLTKSAALSCTLETGLRKCVIYSVILCALYGPVKVYRHNQDCEIDSKYS